MSKAIGIKAFLDKTFDVFEFDGIWKAHLGKPEKTFQMLVYGHSGNGKTDYAIKFAKYLAGFSIRVLYNSYEEGICRTLQEAIQRNDLLSVDGKVIFTNKESLNEMITRLKKKGSPQVVIIDSRDYMNMTTEQYKTLVKLFPRKAFITLCWESAGKPKSQYAKDIEYMCDIKVQVRNFKAYPRCRFGGNETFVIWNKQAKMGEQIQLLEH